MTQIYSWHSHTPFLYCLPTLSRMCIPSCLCLSGDCQHWLPGAGHLHYCHTLRLLHRHLPSYYIYYQPYPWAAHTLCYLQTGSVMFYLSVGWFLARYFHVWIMFDHLSLLIITWGLWCGLYPGLQPPICLAWSHMKPGRQPYSMFTLNLVLQMLWLSACVVPPRPSPWAFP